MKRTRNSRITVALATVIMLAAALFLPASAFAADSAAPKAAAPIIKPYTQFESGAVKLLSHTYRSGVSPANSDFNFVTEGGQEILFPFERYLAGMTIAGRHDVQFLYQPLLIDTEVTFRAARTFDSVTFAAGTPMRLTYSFPFYRVTYRYRFLGDAETGLSAGGAVQLRNASIRIASQDGTKQVVSQNLGVVPALSLGGRAAIGKRGFVEMEATGIYASSAIFNGANFQFEGSILDASLRGGVVLNRQSEAFINLRYFGGTAAGTSQYPVVAWTESVDKSTDNRISALSVTLGATLKLVP